MLGTDLRAEFMRREVRATGEIGRYVVVTGSRPPRHMFFKSLPLHGRPPPCTPGARVASPSCSARSALGGGAASAGSTLMPSRRAASSRRGRRRRPRRRGARGVGAGAHSRLGPQLAAGAPPLGLCFSRPRARRRGARVALGPAEGGIAELLAEQSSTPTESKAQGTRASATAEQPAGCATSAAFEVGSERPTAAPPRGSTPAAPALRRVAPALVAARQRRRPQGDRDGVADGSRTVVDEQRAVVVAVAAAAAAARLSVAQKRRWKERNWRRAPIAPVERRGAPRAAAPTVAKCRKISGNSAKKHVECVNATVAEPRQPSSSGDAATVGPPSDRGPAGAHLLVQPLHHREPPSSPW